MTCSIPILVYLKYNKDSIRPKRYLQTFKKKKMSSFCNQSALMVSKSESIIRRINNDYPTLSQLFLYNREGTTGFLKANGGLYGFSLSHEFNVPHSGSDNIKAWSDDRDAIEHYLEKICDRVKADDPLTGESRSFREELRPA